MVTAKPQSGERNNTMLHKAIFKGSKSPFLALFIKGKEYYYHYIMSRFDADEPTNYVNVFDKDFNGKHITLKQFQRFEKI